MSMMWSPLYPRLTWLSIFLNTYVAGGWTKNKFENHMKKLQATRSISKWLSSPAILISCKNGRKTGPAFCRIHTNLYYICDSVCSPWLSELRHVSKHSWKNALKVLNKNVGVRSSSGTHYLKREPDWNHDVNLTIKVMIICKSITQ